MTTRQHTVLSAILLILGAYLIRMSAVEIQPSPEGFIAQAGHAIERHGLVFDVAPYSSGGLTTGLIPPGTPTMIAIGSRMFGGGQAAARWFSIVCVGLSLWLTYRIGMRFLSHQGAMQAVVTAGMCVPLLVYGRQANLDVAGLPLLLAGILLLLLIAESQKRDTTFTYTASYLLVCATVGVVSWQTSILLLVLSVITAFLTRRWIVLVAGIVGIGVAFPWLLMMFATYGDQVLLASSIDVPASEPRLYHTGPLDAIALLITAAPVFVLSILWCISAVFYRTLIPAERQTTQRLIAVWFVVSILLVAIDEQKGMHSFISFAPCCALLSAYAMEEFRRQQSPRLILVGLTLTAVATFIVLIFLGAAQAGVLRLGAIAVGGTYAAYAAVRMFSRGKLKRGLELAASLDTPVYVGSIVVSAVAAFCIVVFGGPYTIQGARSVAYEIKDGLSLDDTFTYLFHKHAPTDGMNAQLDWYLDGWMTGQIIGHRHQEIPLPADGVREESISIIKGTPAIVYYHPGADIRHLETVRRILDTLYTENVHTKDYTLFVVR